MEGQGDRKGGGDRSLGEGPTFSPNAPGSTAMRICRGHTHTDHNREEA